MKLFNRNPPSTEMLPYHHGPSPSSDLKENNEIKQVYGMSWSLRPLALFLKFLTGVQIYPNLESKAFLKWIFKTYSILMMVLNLSTQYITYRLESFTTTIELELGRKKDKNDNDRNILEIISSVQIMVVHLVFFNLQFSEYWGKFWETVKQVNNSIGPDRDFYKWCRKIVLTGCIFPFLELASSSWALYYSIMADCGGFFINQFAMVIFILMNFLAVMTSACIPTFVFCMIIIAGGILDILDRELDVLRQEYLESKNSKRLLIALNEWKRKHLLSAGLIDRINNCFGFIILLVILRVCVFIIINSYNILTTEVTKRGEMGAAIFPWVGIILDLLYLFMAVLSACYIQNKVSSILENLFELNSCINPQLQDMVYSTLLQAYDETPCIITAAGFIEVKLTIIPLLVATTFGYILLVYDRVFENLKLEDPATLENCSSTTTTSAYGHW